MNIADLSINESNFLTFCFEEVTDRTTYIRSTTLHGDISVKTDGAYVSSCLPVSKNNADVENREH